MGSASEGQAAGDGDALPLAGLRVLEFCHTIMGPTAGLVLADLGADVVKVEPGPGGDRTRRLPGFAAGFFGTFNRNKRSLVVDVKTAEGLALVHRLLASADVVLENFAPGTMERLGCGWETARRLNPRLVFCALKGFLSGPYEHRPALDEVVQFMGGLAYMTGPPGRPLRAGASVVDIMGGTFAVVAVLAALRERERTGRGQHVKSALFESTVFLVAQHMAGRVVTGRPVPPMPARQGAWGIYEPFETADGEQVFVGITSDNHWQRFCERFELADLIADPRYATNEDRVRERSVLLPRVARTVAAYPKEALVAILDAIGVPFAPVVRPEDLFADPHLQASGLLVDTDLGRGRRAPLPKLPVELGGHDLGLRTQPPAAGADTRAILRELGLSAAAIDDLIAREVVSGPE